MRELLPPHPHELDGVELVARYRPSGDEDMVGGGFYDVYPVGAVDPEAGALVERVHMLAAEWVGAGRLRSATACSIASSGCGTGWTTGSPWGLPHWMSRRPLGALPLSLRRGL
ncbi:hypothetical protein E1293_21435 [Actinomadura darangshiensis]|uniref:Uncharacterized protein n=1 Tax=Actinomadura darangshiensis TaxID=705336 RepID=A0A4R5B690_9ACTN|nr:hypothetical protein [Actinomadura darangshiensis]TDD80140.1 hypothetical protein E1293_21435 [Actinomadura darangshiensis]